MAKQNRIAKLCLVAAVALFLILNTCVSAFAGTADLSRKCSVTFTMVYDGSPVSGGSLKMYRIAEWEKQERSYTFAWVPELADAGLDLGQLGSEDFARHVFMLIESRSLPSLSDVVSADGTVTFTNLESGVYVVYQTEPAKGYEPINAFCVSLPMALGDDFVYDVQAAPKPRPEKTTESTTESTTSESSTSPEDTTASGGTTAPHTSEDPTSYTTYTTPTPPADEPVTQPYTTQAYAQEAPPIISMEEKLPQTGQLWWPTWMLGAFGAILLGLGIMVRMLIRQSAEESEI